MKINCLGCGFKLDLDEAYDDYDGPVKCYACETTLEIHTEQGFIKSVQQENAAIHPAVVRALDRGHSRAKVAV